MSPTQIDSEKTKSTLAFSEYLGQFVGEDAEWEEYVVYINNRPLHRFRYEYDAIVKADRTIPRNGDIIMVFLVLDRERKAINRPIYCRLRK